MVGDENDRDALLAVELFDGREHLAPADGVEHGGRLVEHDALGFHRQHTRDGDALLLSAGEQMRRVLDKLRHADGLERVVHALSDLGAWHAQILRCECDVLFDDVRHDLVVRVLEHHAHAPANFEQERLVHRVHALDIDLAAAWQQDCVEGLGKRRFSAAVVAEDHDKAAALDGHIHPAQRAGVHLVFRARIGEGQVLGLDHFHKSCVP